VRPTLQLLEHRQATVAAKMAVESNSLDKIEVRQHDETQRITQGVGFGLMSTIPRYRAPPGATAAGKPAMLTDDSTMF
jgi:hypothetical protein